jgi:HD-GYP domain-containing protein (c-di-GMP phosphodiesterase class II)
MSNGLESKANSARSQQLALALASAIRTAAYYDGRNSVMQQACSTLMSLLTEASEEEGSVSVGVLSHCLFVDKVRVPTSVSTYERFTFLMQLFDEWRVRTLTFLQGLNEDELMRALALVSRARPTETADLESMLRAGDVELVEVEAIPEEEETGSGPGSMQISPILAYSAAMRLGGELSKMSGSLEPGTVRRVRHVTQAIVDEILRDPAAVLALTTIKDLDDYLILHSTNVAVLSTLLGRRLGLGKARLGELCLAGFLHDAGKLGVDSDVLQKPGSLDAEEWKEIRRHPLLAAYALLGRQRLTSSNMRAVVVAFEHHLNYDLSGYPSTELKKSLSLYGSIVSIADRFDALTTARVYRKVNLTPSEAVMHVVENSGTHFDPVLVKLFVQVMGLYPPGTVVVLNEGEAGVVCAPPSVGAPLDRPHVRLLVGKEPGIVRDLTERVDGEYARSVLAVLNPSNKGQIPAIDPAILDLVG